MLVLNKKAKIITAALVFALIAASGYAIEYFERDAFIEEVVTEEDAVSYIPGSGANSQSGLININFADAEELSELHGIGKSLSARIVDYRGKNGEFETIEEIMKVPGISESKFEDIKEFITVE